MQLKSYIALSGAFLANHSMVAGQLWYSDFDPDTLIEAVDVFPYSSEIEIDMNGDGILDVQIEATAFSDGTFRSDSVNVTPLNGALIATNFFSTYYGGDFVARGVIDGSTISSSLNFNTGRQILFRWWAWAGYPAYNVGGFVNPASIAVKIPIDGSFHYGWIRCERLSAYDQVLIYDHGLNAIPEAPVVAGDLSGPLLHSGVRDVEATVKNFPGSGDHIQLKFDVPADESDIIEYRVYLTEASLTDSLNANTLTLVGADRYLRVLPDGSAKSVYFPFSKQTIQGGSLNLSTGYRAIVGTVVSTSAGAVSFVSNLSETVVLGEIHIPGTKPKEDKIDDSMF